MEYVHILNLIDAYLDRLTKARDLLGALDDSASSAVAPVRGKNGSRSSVRAKQTELALELIPAPARPERLKTEPKAGKNGNGRAANRGALFAQNELFSPEAGVVPEPAEGRRRGRPAKAKTLGAAPGAEAALRSGVAVVSTLAATVGGSDAASGTVASRSAVTSRSAPVTSRSAPVTSRPAAVASETAAVVSGTVVRVRAQRRPTTRRRSAGVPESRALGGAVSAAPVFIPAEKIRQERTQKELEAAASRESQGPSEAAPLTAEMLTQRWVQGLTS
jgi:hypothetical protein